MRVHKLLKLLEQHMNEGRGVAGYRGQLRECLGITENDSGEPVIDRREQVINPRNVSLQEVAMTFLGRNFGVSDLRRAVALTEQAALLEAEGHVVMPSHFAKISAFSDTVSGLIDALTMEAYDSPEFIGDNLMETKEARVNGGKMIGIMNDGKSGDDLLDGEPYPTVGLKETYVDIPDNKRRGNAIQVNEKVFIYDRTDMVESACTNAGTATRRLKEIDQAKVVLGITNPYSRDGKSASTYQGVAGDKPVDYVNESLNVLTSEENVDAAIQVLEGNTDPGTGFEISIPTAGAQVLVMPQRQMRARHILYPEWVRRQTTASDSAAHTEQSKSSLPNLDLVVLTRLWYNLLVDSGVSADNAQDRWHLGLFKRAFKYRQIIPFEIKDAPLTGEDVRRDIVMVKVAREHGVPFVAEPRWVYRGSEEASSLTD